MMILFIFCSKDKLSSYDFSVSMREYDNQKIIFVTTERVDNMLKKMVTCLMVNMFLVFAMSAYVFALDTKQIFPVTACEMVVLGAESFSILDESADLLEKVGIGFVKSEISSGEFTRRGISYALSVTRHPNAETIEINESDLESLFYIFAELMDLGFFMSSFDGYFLDALDKSGIFERFVALNSEYTAFLRCEEDRRQIIEELATLSHGELLESGWLSSLDAKGMIEEFIELRGKINPHAEPISSPHVNLSRDSDTEHFILTREILDTWTEETFEKFGWAYSSETRRLFEDFLESASVPDLVTPFSSRREIPGVFLSPFTTWDNHHHLFIGYSIHYEVHALGSPLQTMYIERDGLFHDPRTHHVLPARRWMNPTQGRFSFGIINRSTGWMQLGGFYEVVRG